MNISDIINKSSPLYKQKEMSKSEYKKLVDRNTELIDKMKDLQDQLQQKENIIKEVREYIEKNSLYEQDYDYDYEENLVEYPPSDEQAKKDILEILDKGE